VKWESVTFCQPFVKALLKTCFSGLKSSRWVGDFQVATGGGFWVATRARFPCGIKTLCFRIRKGLNHRQKYKQFVYTRQGEFYLLP
ncbi:MAG: hypothetical protein Q8O28_07440, partial [Smithellaceae bacterium]|nr:hypothetical protein [Smithellaceae bacterium]